MKKYEYVLSNDGMPGGTTYTIEADEYKKELNESSRMYEYIFYRDGEKVHIVRADWLAGRIKEIT